MRRQLQGIGLLLLGIQMMLLTLWDPWIPVLGDAGRVMYPILAVGCDVAGLFLCFQGKSE